MGYDVFTFDEDLAERVLTFSRRAFCVDKTENPDLYQFFDFSEDDMRRIKDLLYGYGKSFEIRGYEKGEIIWPCVEGFTLEQALDIL